MIKSCSTSSNEQEYLLSESCTISVRKISRYGFISSTSFDNFFEELQPHKKTNTNKIKTNLIFISIKKARHFFYRACIIKIKPLTLYRTHSNTSYDVLRKDEVNYDKWKRSKGKSNINSTVLTLVDITSKQ